MSAAVELRDVTYRYAPEMPPALEDVSLDVRDADYIGLIGPNGGGKTTLIRIMLGLLRPQRGTATLFGRPPERARRFVGYVPQHASLNPIAPATVLDIVRLGRLGRSSWGCMTGASHTRAAMDALARVGASDLASRSIRSLSGGQRQRVLIARALAADARLLILDEPMAGVDDSMQHGLTTLLEELNSHLPIIVVTHDVGFVAHHVKHVACLNRRLAVHPASDVSEATIAELYPVPVHAVHHDHHCPPDHLHGHEHEHETRGTRYE